MSHNIKTHDKQQGLTMAWHGLTEIKSDLSLDNNWLSDWDIKPTQLNVCRSAGDYIATDYSILTATDDPAITIGVPFNPNSYRPLYNREFVQMMKDATEGIDGVRLVSIGSVRNRGRVFASFETQALETYEAGGRKFKPFLNFGNGHDKSSAVWINTSNICTVCDNTFEMNLQHVEAEVVKASSKVYHRKHLIARLPDLALIIRQAVQSQRNFAMAFESLAETKIGYIDAQRALVGFVVNGDEKMTTRAWNTVLRMVGLFRHGRGNSGETLADLFSAVTDYYTHEAAGNGDNPPRQFASSEFGSGAQRKKDFFLHAAGNRCEELIKRGAKILEAQSK